MEYIGNVVQAALSRRGFLVLVGTGLSLPWTSAFSKSVNFTGIRPDTEDRLVVPPGFEHKVLIRWGDPLKNDKPLDWNRIYQNGPTQEDVEAQKHCFGYNCDYVGFLPLSKGGALLVVNHEYTNPELMFADFEPSDRRPTKEEALLMLEAHGISMVELSKHRGEWTYVKGSSYNRRITGSTPCQLSGPAKGHPLMRSSYDPKGEYVLGTLNNCSGGKTPWGTVLSCEENFHSYFWGDDRKVRHPQAGLIREINYRYGVPGDFARAYGFYRHKERFVVEKEPTESLRFGWVVEIDPYDPKRPPVKRTALGRFKHEAATCVVAPDRRVVVYMGDDERFEYVYKFITKGTYNPNNREANMELLDEGELYVARFDEDLTGRWILIARCEKSSGNDYRVIPNPDLPEPFKSDPVLCFINTRTAADILGGTKMDRPEDFEWNPVTKSLWLALTFNERRTRFQTDRANPRAFNSMGHVIEIVEEGQDPTAKSFRWHIPLLCGLPKAKNPAKQLLLYGKPVKGNTPPISAPDNLTFDRHGNVWIATDGNESTSRLGKKDGVYVLNPFTRELKMFLSGVPG
ncbi:MAG: PhoX family phosphatase, partial [Aquificaceae bacterium]|nr:PhoX family phosphatase [Aquificaceae bacterium]